MSLDGNLFLCRLCQKSDAWYFDVFDARATNGIQVCEVIRELIQIEVNEDDGLPTTACHECCKKLGEFSDFKKMCVESATELKRKWLTSEGCRVKMEPIEFEDDGPPSRTESPVGDEARAGFQSGDATVAQGGIPEGVDVASIPSIVPEMGSTGVVTLGTNKSANKANVEEEKIVEDELPEERSPVLDEEVAPKTVSGDESSSEIKGHVKEERVTEDELPEERSPVLDGEVVPKSVSRDESSSEIEEVHSAGPFMEPVEVFVNVREGYALPSRGDGPSKEKDPLCEDGEANPLALITMSTERVLRVEHFSTTQPSTGSVGMIPRVKVEVDDGTTETCSDAAEGSSKAFEASCPSGVLGREGSSGSVGGRECPLASRGPPNRDVDRSGHPLFSRCDECGKVCVSRYLLKIHKRIHKSAGDLIACKSCGKHFATKGNLKIHIRTHTGERPYGCTVCGMSFAQKGTLERHQRTHTGEKPYACTACEKRFTTQDGLRNHERTHTRERPYPCEVCGRRYRGKNQLIAHGRIHTGEKPFCCVACGKRFGRKDALNYHLQTHLDNGS